MHPPDRGLPAGVRFATVLADPAAALEQYTAVYDALEKMGAAKGGAGRP